LIPGCRRQLNQHGRADDAAGGEPGGAKTVRRSVVHGFLLLSIIVPPESAGNP
jgi:hypothetical protein